MELRIKSKHISSYVIPLIRCAVAGLGLLPVAAMALSVGPIQVASYLNQSLMADISLSNFDDLDETQIKISVAKNVYFTKAGAYKAPWLSDLDFVVIKNPDDTGVIQLRTQRPIKDPVVDLLISISWPSGKMIRQYTVLLDPTDIVANPVPEGYLSATAKSSSANPGLNTARNSQIDFGYKYGPIKPEDNLWQIAHKMVASSKHTAAQGVLAIYEKNLGAFHEQNMNKLKEGAILHLPEKFEVAQIIATEAGDKIAASPKLAVAQPHKTSVQVSTRVSSASLQPMRNSKPLKILSPTSLEELVKKKIL